MYLVKNTKEEKSKFSFSVSKKIAKSAVFRNKLRRQGYASVREFLSKIEDGYLFFFSIKSVSGLDYKTLKKEVFELLSSSLVLS